MTESKHTPEPWRLAVGNGRRRVMAGSGSVTTAVDPRADDNRARANANRIVACVNGCKGIPDPETDVPELVAALRDIGDYLGDSADAHRLAQKARAALAKLGAR